MGQTIGGSNPLLSENGGTMFHKHSWEVISDKTFESELERLLKLGASNYEIHFCSRDSKNIMIMKCECGKIKKFVTRF
jgi:hypothetical protein